MNLYPPLVIFASVSGDILMIVYLLVFFGGGAAFFTRKLWMPFVKGLLPAQFQALNSISSQRQEAGKRCAACGAANDDFLANCKFCNAPLPVIATQDNSNEALLEDFSEIVGALENRQVLSMGRIGLRPDSRVGKRYNQEGLMALDVALSGIVRVPRKMLLAEAQKILDTLKIRSLSNPTLATLVAEYGVRLESQK